MEIRYSLLWLIILLAVLSCALLPGVTHATGSAAIRPIDQQANQLDAFIPTVQGQYGVPGVAVAVVRDGKVILLKGYGVRAFGKPDAVDKDTIFQLASMSKMFTAAALGTLVDDQKLDWDDPVYQHLPEFVLMEPYATRYTTVRDLLAHRTGLPAFGGDFLTSFGYSRPGILARARFLPPAVSLREKAEYSNLSFFIAGEVAARVSNSSWEKVVQDRLLTPLGMGRSRPLYAEVAGKDNLASNHAIVGGKLVIVPPTDTDLTGAAGSVVSTASDMGRWLQMFLNNGTFEGKQILQSKRIAEIYERSMVSDIGFTELPPISEKTGFYYGLGFASFDYAGHRVIEKGGALAGVRTVMTLVPDLNAGIVVLCNLNVSVLPEAVRAYFLDKLLGIAPDANQRAIFEQNKKIQQIFIPATPPANPGKYNGDVKDLAGVYKNRLYGRCELTPQDDRLSLWVECGPGRYRGTLKHWDNGVFMLTWPNATLLPQALTFTIGEDGTASSFTNDTLGVFSR
jgi:CubicO group peptidase (beta-lactamase class C family)